MTTRRAPEASARRRRRARKLLLVATVTTFMMVGATVLVLPMSWRRPANGAPTATMVPRAPRGIPRVSVAKGSISLDGHEVARTEIIEETQRMQRIDGLFDAIRARRFDDDSVGPPAVTVDVVVDPDVPVVVVKSVLQTLAFAGFSDVRFAATDAGSAR